MFYWQYCQRSKNMGFCKWVKEKVIEVTKSYGKREGKLAEITDKNIYIRNEEYDVYSNVTHEELFRIRVVEAKGVATGRMIEIHPCRAVIKRKDCHSLIVMVQNWFVGEVCREIWVKLDRFRK